MTYEATTSEQSSWVAALAAYELAKAGDYDQRAYLRRLMLTPAPDAKATALKLSLMGGLSEVLWDFDFREAPEVLGELLDKPGRASDCSSYLAHIYLDVVRLAGGEDLVAATVAKARTAHAEDEGRNLAFAAKTAEREEARARH